MPAYRSKTSTAGRNMAGARALWRATGMKDGDFDKPIIAIANSFTQFVPGHVHLKDLGQLAEIESELAELQQQLRTLPENAPPLAWGWIIFLCPFTPALSRSVAALQPMCCDIRNGL